MNWMNWIYGLLAAAALTVFIVAAVMLARACLASPEPPRHAAGLREGRHTEASLDDDWTGQLAAIPAVASHLPGPGGDCRREPFRAGELHHDRSHLDPWIAAAWDQAGGDNARQRNWQPHPAPALVDGRVIPAHIAEALMAASACDSVIARAAGDPRLDDPALAYIRDFLTCDLPALAGLIRADQLALEAA